MKQIQQGEAVFIQRCLGLAAAAWNAAPLPRFSRCRSVATGGKRQDLIGASSIAFTPGGLVSRFPGQGG